MRNNVDLVKGYVRTLFDSDLVNLNDRLTQRFFNDLAESLKIVQDSPEVDRWLSSARNSEEFFEMVDLLQAQVALEVNKRNAVSTS